jgi:death-on-curing protein
MIRLAMEKVRQLHRMMTDATGGDPGLRDVNLLDSALESAFQTFGGEELYPTVEEKAARLGFSLIANHAFVDGNKRIGVFVMLIFLEINGVSLVLDDEDVIRVGLDVAAGKMKYDALLAWIREKRR